MAIKVSGTTVIDDSRGLTNIATVDATTAAAIGAAGVGGGGTADFTATGTIASGDVVGLNSDGTVSVIEKSTLSLGSANTFTTSTSPDQIACAYHVAAKKVVIAYRDGTTNYLMATHGTISGDTITFSTPVTIESSNSLYVTAFYNDMFETVIILYGTSGVIKQTNYTFDSSGNAIYGDVFTGASGQSPVYLKGIWHNKSSRVFAIYEDFTSNKAELISWEFNRRQNGSDNQPQVYNDRIMQVSLSNPSDPALTYDESSDCILVAYTNSSSTEGELVAVRNTDGPGNNSWHQQKWIGAIMPYDSGVGDTEVAYDPASNTCLVFYRVGTTNKVFACRIEPNTLQITRGPALTVSTDNSYRHTLNSSPKNGQMLLTYTVSNTAKAFLFSINAGTLEVTLDSSATLASSTDTQIQDPTLAYDPYNNRFILPYVDTSDNQGKAKVLNPEAATMDAESCIGVSTENISNGSTGSITVNGGVNENMTGLSSGKTYYLNHQGELTTSVGVVEVGKAISATKMLVNIKELNSNVSTLTASEDIFKGQPVSLRKDGTIVPVLHNVGVETTTTITTSTSFFSDIVYDPVNDVYIVAYKRSSDGKGCLVKITVGSNDTLTFSTPIVFSINSIDSLKSKICYDTFTGRAVLMYWDNYEYNWRLISYDPSTSTVDTSNTLTAYYQGDTSSEASMVISRQSRDYNTNESVIYVAYGIGSAQMTALSYRVSSSGVFTLNNYRTISNPSGNIYSIDMAVTGNVLIYAVRDQGYNTAFWYTAQNEGFNDSWYGPHYPQLYGESQSSNYYANMAATLRAESGLDIVGLDNGKFVVSGHWQGAVWMYAAQVVNPDNTRWASEGNVKYITSEVNTSYGCNMFAVDNTIYRATLGGGDRSVFISARFTSENIDSLEITDAGMLMSQTYPNTFAVDYMPSKDKVLMVYSNTQNQLTGYVYDPFRNHRFVGFAQENINSGSSGKVLTEGGIARGVNGLPKNKELNLLFNGNIVPNNRVDLTGIKIGSSVGPNEVAISRG